jgi:Holliday junction resolvase RusA-like endonuclease
MTEQTVLWTPRAKQRPRAHVVQGRAVSYTPRESMQAEREIAAQWVAAPIEGPIAVSLALTDTMIMVQVDEMEEPVNRKLLRGDIDNYAKLVLDALNGRAWIDDRQIAALYVVKV